MSKTVEEAFHAFMDQWRSRPTAGAYIFPPSSEDVFAAGAAHGAAEALAIATSLERIQVEGQWLIDLDELERRLRENNDR